MNLKKTDLRQIVAKYQNLPKIEHKSEEFTFKPEIKFTIINIKLLELEDKTIPFYNLLRDF